VDIVLRPKTASAALSTPDYLDALVTVREKLSGLYLLLVEFCKVGENAELPSRKDESLEAMMSILPSEAGQSSSQLLEQSRMAETTQEELRKNSNEDLRLFLEDQVSQVFHAYLRDYFTKEVSFIK
jgi:hypothetical protein